MRRQADPRYLPAHTRFVAQPQAVGAQNSFNIEDGQSKSRSENLQTLLRGHGGIAGTLQPCPSSLHTLTRNLDQMRGNAAGISDEDDEHERRAFSVDAFRTIGPCDRKRP